MTRLVPWAVLVVAVGASCGFDPSGLHPGSGGSVATTMSSAGTGGGMAGSGGAGGAQATSSATSASTGAVGPGWKRRRKLELDSGVGVMLGNFPLLVLLKKERIDYKQTQDEGQDLRFTDDQDTVLDHEIETWDEGGASVVWVRIPSLKENTSPLPTIWMYYGNDEAADGQKVNGVWSDGYHGVWHLGESGDAFSNSSGTKKAINYGAVQTNGLFGKGRSFHAKDRQYIDTDNTDYLKRFTVEVLVRSDNPPSTANGPNGPLMREGNYQIVWDHMAPFNGTLSFKPGSQEWTSSSMKPLDSTGWYYLAATYDGTTLRTYKDGGHQNSDQNVNEPEYTGWSAKIGRHALLSEDKNFFDGEVDEVRIAERSRPDEWFIAQNRSMRDTLVKFGSQEIPAVPWQIP